MSFHASPARPDEIGHLRDQYLRELNAQAVHYSWLGRGFATPYSLHHRERLVGYGLAGTSDPGAPAIITEFFVVPESRASALPLFRGFVRTSGASSVLAQTNDTLLSLMLFDCAAKIHPRAVLFHDMGTTRRPRPPRGSVFRRLAPGERAEVFTHTTEPVGDWAIEADGAVVATGGYLTHYNPPYADLYMEVAPSARRRGYGSFLVQELKRVCLEAGYTPAARCSPTNAASRACLAAAGFLPCARVLEGILASDADSRS